MGILSAQRGQGAAATPPLAETQALPPGAEMLGPLLAPLTDLRGVGPGLARLIAEAAGGDRVLDLLFHLPERVVLRRRIDDPAEAPADTEVILPATIRSLRAAVARTGRPYVEAKTTAAGRPLTIRYINGRLAWLKEKLPVGQVRFFAGKVLPEGSGFAMLNPLSAVQEATLPLAEPVWPLVRDLSQGRLAAAIRAALDRLPELPEWLAPALLRREGWPGFAAAIRALQAPEGTLPEKPRRRLAYDELLAGQLALGLVRRRVRARPGRALTGNGALRDRGLAAFGQPLTPSQAQAVAEIEADLAAPTRMLRLLQGDVGSGKTLVAVMAMLQAVEAGAQAALMAPTEILARQHLRTLARLCLPAGVRVELLTGSVKGAQRKRVLAGLAEGAIPIVVGTHALFQESVEFRDLGLAVVDEQHRFGVAQRLMLAGKGSQADMLVMTATPIPRTLLLTQWGEMAVSRLTGKPAGRQPVITRVAPMSRRLKVIERLEKAIERGERAYWVVRAIEGSEHDDNVTAEERFAELSARFPGRVGLAHGEQDLATRETALANFAAGKSSILVATTVIEVGVDVPEATIMVIEQAERFGLSALHQLRGRVGRGSQPSYCLLLYSQEITHRERERLLILRDTDDGFRIAEEDLRLRGGGDLLGTRQAGAALFRLGLRGDDEESASAAKQEQDRLLHMAHQDAELLLEKDPQLASERGRAARLLLALFGKEAAMETLHAG